jgi:spoIIIJ-associated protein
MEWVETTGRTVDEAKGRALDQLGVAEDDAEFEVLDEPRPGLFGRLRGEARVRARVRPTQPRPKLDRRDRRKRGEGPKNGSADAASSQQADEADDGTAVPTGRGPSGRSRRGRRGGSSTARTEGQQGGGSRPAAARPAESDEGADRHDRGAERPTIQSDQDEQKETTVDAQRVGDEAQRFVQGLVDAFGLSGTTTVRRDGDEIEVVVDGTDLGLLVGPRGATLQAIQELARVASQRRLGDHDTRLRVDIAGYRERRREALARFANQVAAQVVADGTAKRLEPMSSADRKIVHDVLAGVDGVVTRSEGDDPQRCVVIEPANA